MDRGHVNPESSWVCCSETSANWTVDVLSNPEAAFELIEEFLPSLRKDALELMVITIQTQVALGYLGVAFIQSAQVRQNLLLTVDRRHETPTSAAHFARHAISFMALVAIPYMLERTLMENVGHYTFAIFANKVERSLRIQNLFPAGETHQLCLFSAVTSTNLTVDTYADQTLGYAWIRLDTLGYAWIRLGTLDNFAHSACALSIWNKGHFRLWGFSSGSEKTRGERERLLSVVSVHTQYHANTLYFVYIHFYIHM